MRIFVIGSELHCPATHRIGIPVFQPASGGAIFPFASIIGALQHDSPCFGFRTDAFRCGRAPLSILKQVLTHFQVFAITPTQNRISGVRPEFGQSLMPVFRITSSFRVSRGLNNLLARYDFADVIKKERLYPGANTMLFIFPRQNGSLVSFRQSAQQSFGTIPSPTAT